MTEYHQLFISFIFSQQKNDDKDENYSIAMFRGLP